MHFLSKATLSFVLFVIIWQHTSFHYHHKIIYVLFVFDFRTSEESAESGNKGDFTNLMDAIKNPYSRAALKQISENRFVSLKVQVAFILFRMSDLLWHLEVFKVRECSKYLTAQSEKLQKNGVKKCILTITTVHIECGSNKNSDVILCSEKYTSSYCFFCNFALCPYTLGLAMLSFVCKMLRHITS